MAKQKTKADLEAEAKAREAEMAELQAQLEAAKKKADDELAEAKAREDKLKADLQTRESEKADAEARARKVEEDAAKKQTPIPNLVWVLGAAVVALIIVGIVIWWTNRSGHDSKTETTRSKSFEQLQDRVNVLQAQIQSQPTVGEDEVVLPSEPTVTADFEEDPLSPEARQATIERTALIKAAQAPGGSSTYLPQAEIRFATGEAATEYERGEGDRKRLEAVKKIETARFNGHKDFRTAEREVKQAEQEAQKAEGEAEQAKRQTEAESQESIISEKARAELKAAQGEAERAKNEANSLRAKAEELKNSLSVANTSATLRSAYEANAEKRILSLEQQIQAISENIGDLTRTIESREKTIIVPANPCR